jgi:protein arginine N-methyltransferase 1
MGYAVDDYGDMIADTVRMDAYHEALRRVVTPGCVVVDVGTGTGIAALLACSLGAGRVYAIEPDPVIEVARRCAADNGFADRITFVRDVSERVELPGRADVVVSDLRGVLPLYGRHLPAVIDARERFLAPGGALLPGRDTVWAALVEAPEAYARLLGPWRDHARGLDLSAARSTVEGTFMRVTLGADALLTPPGMLFELDYRTLTGPNAHGETVLPVDRPGTAHGLCVWFDAELVDGVGFGNAPGRPRLVYGQAFFPFREPVAVVEGDLAPVVFAASLVDDDYVFRWDTAVADADGTERAAHRQSTLDSLPLSAGLLRRSSESHRPVLGVDGEVALTVLELMDGGRTLGEIADVIAERFPAVCRSRPEALRAVTRLSQAYTR